MSEYIEIIKYRKLENIILKIIIIVFCFLTIIINLNEYKSLFKNNTNIENSINENYRFVTLDLTPSKLISYSIIDNNENKVNFYTLELNDKILLIALKENTVITNKVEGELKDYDKYVNVIKNKYNENGKLIEEKYFSNVSYNTNKKIVEIKFYFTIILLIIIILTLPFDIFIYINPKKSKKFKDS